MNEIKLLALDMDGTSYHVMEGVIDENIIPIKACIEKGVKTIFITGRPILAKHNKFSENGFIGIDSIVIGYNSGCIYDLNTNKVIQSNTIDIKNAKKVFDWTIQNNPETLIWGYVDDFKTCVLSRPYKNETECFYEPRFFDGNYVLYEDIKKNFNFNFFKILAFNGNENLFSKFTNDFKLNVSSNDNKLAEINANGLNKAYGLKWIANYFKIPMKNTAAIGDGMNDLSMIQEAGVGVAIKNSHQELKNICDVYIDKTNTQGAVKEFIEKYILGDK